MSNRVLNSLLCIPLLIGMPILFSGCGPKSAESRAMKNVKPALPVMTLTPAVAPVETEYSAMLEGKGNVDIRPEVDGTLSEICVEEGAFVKEGQILFKIDDRIYREQYNSALAAQHAAEASYSYAKLNEDKLVPLVQNNVVSDIQLKTAKASSQAALATVEQQKGTARSARVNLEYTVIKAPMSGYIGKISFRKGNLVSKNQQNGLTTLSDVSSIYANFSMSELAFSQFREQYAGSTIQEKVKKVSPVTFVMSDGTVYSEKGTLGTISGQFDQGTGSIRVRALFPNPKALLRASSSGKVVIETLYRNALLVPQSATVELQDKILAFVVGPGGSVKKQVITVAANSGDNYVVSEGLAPGAVIVTSGVDKLQEGAIIRPVSTPAPAGAAPSVVAAAPVKETHK